MPETYSLAITGASANQQFGVENLTLPDSSAGPAMQIRAMQTGTQLLCKRPDGSVAYYTLDAERSTPSVPVLVKV